MLGKCMVSISSFRQVTQVYKWPKILCSSTNLQWGYTDKLSHGCMAVCM